MYLSKKGIIQLNNDEANIMSHMCYSAFKLWNVCNYEKRNYKTLGLEKFPNWYYQKKVHKDNIWYKQLPSQTAQSICKLLDDSWKSYFKLLQNKSIENPNPPRFKQDKMPITYVQNGIKHTKEDGITVRLSLPKQLKTFMKDTYNIDANYLFLKNSVFQDIDVIKEILFYPPDKTNKCEFIVVYEVEEVMLPDNSHYLSVDLGLHNLMTCFDSEGKSFIVGRQYFSIMRKYDKTIGKLQQQNMLYENKKGITKHKPSKHVLKLYEKKRHCLKDYLHKVTSYIAWYCKENNINTVVIGDITNIRKDSNLGDVTNQKLHSLPYNKVYTMLEYKLKLKGITLVKQDEAYTSQCSPLSKEVSKDYAVKSNRKQRGLYITEGKVFNADSVGAFNILRKYLKTKGIEKTLLTKCLSSPTVIKVAV